MVNICLQPLRAAYEVAERELQQNEIPEDGINRRRNSEQKLVCDLLTTVVAHC